MCYVSILPASVLCCVVVFFLCIAPSGTLLAVRGVASSTALLVEVSYRVDDDGGRPTLCEVSYEIGQLERQYTVMVQCVPGVNHTVNITSNVEEYYEYSVRLRVSNAAGSSSSSPLIASVGRLWLRTICVLLSFPLFCTELNDSLAFTKREDNEMKKMVSLSSLCAHE